MRLFILITIFIFSHISIIKADNISDFQIDGIGIGESLLDHFSKTELDNQQRYIYPSKKYYLLSITYELNR